MPRAWIATYYVANKWGSMQERTRMYGASLTEKEVRTKVDNYLRQQQVRGIPVYPQYDLQQELVA